MAGFTVDIKGNATHLDRTLKGVKTSLSSIGTVAGSLTTALAGIGAAGAAAIGTFIVTSSKAAMKIEDLGLQFEVLTGSLEKSKELMAEFRKEEQKSALNTEDYANAAKTILAFGGSAEDVIGDLKTLADVSMGNSERFGSLALAFAQTSAAGRLIGQEVLQFVNAGFNPLLQISQRTGESMAQLKKRMEDGKVGIAEVKQAFKDATSEGGRFYKAIDKGSSTTSAKINQTKAAITQLQVAFGTGFNEGLKDALDATNTFLPQLQEKFTKAGSTIGIAMSDALSGNTEKLALIGEVIGEIILAGIKASLTSGLNNLGGMLGEGVAKLYENNPFMPKSVNDTLAKSTRSFTSSGTTFGEQLQESFSNEKLQSALIKLANMTDATIAKNQKEGLAEEFASAMTARNNQTNNFSAASPFNAFDESFFKPLGAEVQKGIEKAYAKQDLKAKFAN